MPVSFPLQTYGQWSTSSFAESSLYVCPGFFPGIVTYDDGSSIVLGALQSYIFAQKLDPYGNKQWSQPVQVFQNDSSYITSTQLTGYQNWGNQISDGDGGVILFWYDYRNAYVDSNTGFKNNSLYTQHIDKNGVRRWPSNGLKIVGPETGIKLGGMVADGEGGFILAWGENRFGYPGATNSSYIRVVSYDSTGTKRWELATDSSTSNCGCAFVYDIYRGGQRLYFRYYLDGNFFRIIDTTGKIVSQPSANSVGIKSEGDSIVYIEKYITSVNTNDFTVYKINAVGDTSSTAQFSTSSSCNQLVNLVSDGWGGMYFPSTCQDTIIHIDSVGQVFQNLFLGINFGGTAFSDGNHGLVVASNTVANRFNQFGQMVWSGPVTYLQGSTYFPLYAPDNNGGVIAVYWTTVGGIFAQHTGRAGQVGIITGVENQAELPQNFELKQNYPNPFNASTKIRFTIREHSRIKIVVYDILGKEISTLVDQYLIPGEHSTDFDGSQYSSGVYFIVMNAEHFIPQTKKIILLR